MLDDFLKTTRSKNDLRLCLEILKEFKGHESDEEWAMHPFITWEKLEQFEEYLENLTK